MTIHKYIPSREDVARIEMIDKPLHKMKGEGLFEWQFRDVKQLMDLLDLEKEIEAYRPGRSERILDRIYNFRKCYLNLTTGEVTT